MVGIVPHKDLVEWRKGILSYKAICRFLVTIQPLIGIWVHQNPELCNVIYVMPGFVSVVGYRIITQELGPLGIDDGPILWAPDFEVIADFDGSTMFFLHGTEKGNGYIYPGSVDLIERVCNVLLLEVQTKEQKYGSTLFQSKSFVHKSDVELSRKVCRSNSGLSRSRKVIENNEVMVPFSRLGFSDRRKLLEVTTNHIQQKVPDMAIGPLFPRLKDDEDNFQNDLVRLRERRSLLTQMFKLDNSQIDYKGGTFGWPPGKPAEDKPRKALFFLLLSYEESQGQQLLIATKILEGTHYVLHPNGTSMFIANMNEPSSESFPWESDADFYPMNIKYAFMGEGIANGYGFRYPGSKPGSLYIFQNGILAFIWKESRAVLTLQELLKKGERIPALPPIANFSYLTKSYSNVYTGFPNTSACLSLPK